MPERGSDTRPKPSPDSISDQWFRQPTVRTRMMAYFGMGPFVFPSLEPQTGSKVRAATSSSKSGPDSSVTLDDSFGE
jgi:hypothetical protein